MKSHPVNPVHPVKNPWPRVGLGADILNKELRIAEIMVGIKKLLAKEAK